MKELRLGNNIQRVEKPSETEMEQNMDNTGKKGNIVAELWRNLHTLTRTFRNVFYDARQMIYELL
jgi:hypothetical protein